MSSSILLITRKRKIRGKLPYIIIPKFKGGKWALTLQKKSYIPVEDNGGKLLKEKPWSRREKRFQFLKTPSFSGGEA